MGKFTVLVEFKASKETEVEAQTYEEAVAKVRAQEILLSGRAAPVWVDDTAYVTKHLEFRWEVLGPCGKCHTPLVNRPRVGGGWLYDCDPTNGHGEFWCRPCIEKYRNEHPET